MPLSLVQEKSDVLPIYDSGWVKAQGNGAEQILESQVFEEDVMVYLFGMCHRYTNTVDWQFAINDGVQNYASRSWKNIHALGNSSPTVFFNGGIYICTSAPSELLEASGNSLSSQGFQVAAGDLAHFTAESTGTGSDGIKYRFIVMPSNAADLIERVT